MVQQSSLFFLLIQLFLCLLCIQLLAPVFEKLKAPKVFAEIFAGIVLGPTILKNIAPIFYSSIYLSDKNSLIVFSGIQELGLLLLMFCSGLEVEILTKGTEKKLSVISGFIGVVFPFFIAFYLADLFDLYSILGEKGEIDILKYFFAISCSITSIPVISRIFLDLNLIKTKFASMCLSIALIEDLFLYALMAMLVPISLTNSAPHYQKFFHIEAGSFLGVLCHIIITAVIIVACFKIFPQIILRLKNNFLLKKIFINYLSLAFLILLFVSFMSIYLGIPSFLGPFLAGIIIGRTPLQNSLPLEHIKRFSFSTFIPIFFVGIGLKLDLLHSFDFKFFILFLIFSSFLKIIGLALSCLVTKIKIKDALNFGMALNARGGPGIVLASLGLGTKLINESYFVTLVLAALTTSWFASFWLNWKRSEIESFKIE